MDELDSCLRADPISISDADSRLQAVTDSFASSTGKEDTVESKRLAVFGRQTRTADRRDVPECVDVYDRGAIYLRWQSAGSYYGNLSF